MAISTTRITLIRASIIRDGNLKRTENGTAMLTFAVASLNGQKDDKGYCSEIFNVTLWGKEAELVADKIKKGNTVAVDGDLASRKYTGKDGTQNIALDINARNVWVLMATKDTAATGGRSSYYNKNEKNEASNTDVDDDPFATYGNQ